MANPAPTSTDSLTPAQNTASTGVSNAFAGATPSGLTPAQQTAYQGVQKAFATPTVPPTPPPPVTPPPTPPATPPATPTTPPTAPTSPATPSSTQTQTTSSNLTPAAPGATQTPYNFVPVTPGVQTGPNGLPITATSSTGNANVDALVAAQNALAVQAQKVSDTITGISNGQIPLSASDQAQVDGLKQQFQQLISQQMTQNTSATNTAQTRGYQTGAAEYDPSFQVKTIGAIVTAGATKIANLQTQEASAVATLTQALKNNDISMVKDAFAAYQTANQATQDAAKTAISDTQAAINDAHIANVLASGITDPKAIIAELQKQGYTDISSADVSTAIKNLSPEAANIFDIQKQAAANGAPQDVLAAIGKATNASDAFVAAGGYSQTLTGDAAQYQFYAQQAKAAGLTPKSFTDWQNSQTYNKAYQTAAASAAAANAALPVPDPSTGAGLGGTTGGGSILSATGLSIGAFNYLAGNTSALTRLTASQRNAIMNEVTNFANKNGVDVSTLQSQYKALNDVLASNIARENNAKIKGNDVTQTAQQLIDSLKSAGTTADPLASIHGGGSVIGNLSVSNIAAIAAGKEVNSPFAVKYGTNISLLTNDLAGYLAATRSSSPTGNATPTDQDTRDAAKMVYDGLNAGGLQAFNDIIDSNVKKIAGVSGTAVTDTQKQIWSLFGVGNKYGATTSNNDQTIQSQQADEQAAQTSVVNYGNTNTQAQGQIRTLVSQGYSYSDIENILGITP